MDIRGQLSIIEEIDEDNGNRIRFQQEKVYKEEKTCDNSSGSTDDYGGGWHSWQGFEDEEEYEQEEMLDDWSSSSDDYGGNWRSWQGFDIEEEYENEGINGHVYENIPRNWVSGEVESLLEM